MNIYIRTKLFKKRLALLAISGLIGLSGCNEEATQVDTSEPVVPQQASVVVEHALSRMELNTDGYVDMSSRMHVSSKDRQAEVVSVTPLVDSDNCIITDIDSQGFVVDTRNPASCVFDVQVALAELDKNVKTDVNAATNLNTMTEGEAANQTTSITSANSLARVLVSDALSSSYIVPPVSATNAIGECQDFAVMDIVGNEFGYDVSGFTLHDNLAVIGVGNAKANEPSTGMINYCSDDAGTANVIYTLERYNAEEDSTDILQGNISIATSSLHNSAPVAENFLGPTIQTGKSITINVCTAADGQMPGVVGTETSDFCHVASSDDDGDGEIDPIQLLGVVSYNSLATVSDPEDINNLSFDFVSDTSGVHDVTYYISDHQGGYALGVVRINVSGKGPWDDIVLADGTVYTAPLTIEDAQEQSKPYQGINYEDVDGEEYAIAAFNQLGTDALCRSYGMLTPTIDQLNRLYQERGNVNISDNWPAERAFWSNSEGNQVDLATGIYQEDVDTNTPSYATCVYPGFLSSLVNSTAGDAIFAGTSESNLHSVVATVYETDGVPLPAQYVAFYSDAEALTFTQNAALTDENGQATVQVSSSEVGVFNVMANYYNQTLQTTVEFFEDYINSITISGATSVDEKKTIQLQTELNMASGEVHPIEEGPVWTSEDPSYATVDQSGEVTGVKKGTATISSVYDQKIAFHNVTVKEVNKVVERVVVNGPTEIFGKGSTAQLYMTIWFTDGTFTGLSNTCDAQWRSGNTVRATVSNCGLVTSQIDGADHENAQVSITGTYQGKSDSHTIYMRPRSLLKSDDE
ncbi:Ig-like domain-containing protein [Vibrio alginolyticus]|uniref:Ig-like domain-containing protein n=1 Tax=Vibrio TaxID=662 RepID=UPI001F3A6DA9|nr:Ig-like domain-containing protein [Vibrio sp. D54]EMB9236007.1 Ig-like domain-containing protein [Vibrio alginolyticus]MCF7509471.1 Ig-like domain-containing protein [Vibrio sp. D54]